MSAYTIENHSRLTNPLVDIEQDRALTRLSFTDFNRLGVGFLSEDQKVRIYSMGNISSTREKTIIYYGRLPPDVKDLTQDYNVIFLQPATNQFLEEIKKSISRRSFEIEVKKDGTSVIKLLSMTNEIRIHNGSKNRPTRILTEGKTTTSTLKNGDLITLHPDERVGAVLQYQCHNIESTSIDEVTPIAYSGQKFETERNTTLLHFISKHPKLASRPIIEILTSSASLLQLNDAAAQELLNTIKANNNISDAILCPTVIDYSLDLEAYKRLIAQGGISTIPTDYNPEEYIQTYNEGHQAVRLSVGRDHEIVYSACGDAVKKWRILKNNSSVPIVVIDCRKTGKESIRCIPTGGIDVFSGTCVVQIKSGNSYKYIKLSHENNHPLLNAQGTEASGSGDYPTGNQLVRILSDVPTIDPLSKADVPSTQSEIIEFEKVAAENQAVESTALPAKIDSHMVVASDIAGFKIFRSLTGPCPYLATEFLTGINALLEAAKLALTEYFNIEMLPELGVSIEQLGRRVDGDGSFVSWALKQHDDVSENDSEAKLLIDFEGLSKMLSIPYLHQLVFDYITGEISLDNLQQFCNKDPILDKFIRTNAVLIKSVQINYTSIKGLFPTMPKLSIRYGVYRSAEQLRELPKSFNYSPDPRFPQETQASHLEIKHYPAEKLIKTADINQAGVKVLKDFTKPLDKSLSYNLGIGSENYTHFKQVALDLASHKPNLKTAIEKVFREQESVGYFRHPQSEVATGASKTVPAVLDLVFFNTHKAYTLVRKINALLNKSQNSN